MSATSNAKLERRLDQRFEASSRRGISTTTTSMFPSHPFAALLDPAGVLSACAASGALAALPVSAARSADTVSPKVAGELAKHDAALEEMDKQLIAKSSKASPAKSKG